MLRLDRHPLGPRVFAFGRRIHEWQLGLALLALAVGGHAAGYWPMSIAPLLATTAGAWLVAKDWRDLVPSKRDTSSWRVGLHRRAAPLREARRADGLPAFAGSVTFAVGLVNLLSAVTPNIAWRHHLLLQLEPVEVVPVFHTLAVPASAALVAVAFYLRARRHRAWQLALVLTLAIGVITLLKGFDFEEALLSWAATALLWWARDSFYVRNEPLRPISSSVVWLAVLAVGSGSMLAWAGASAELHDELAWGPLAVRGACTAVILVLAYALFRPLAPPGSLPGGEERQAALELLHAHGRDTLAFFKLREDAQYHFSGDGCAFLGYRVSNRVLLIAGDPVGAPEAVPELVREACAFAETRGLRIAALGASEALLDVYREAGLRALYIGDEAIVDTRGFSLDGRPIRKIRQSVARLETAGYSAEALDFERLDDATLDELDQVSALWREGAAERGFTMAMDSLRGPHQAGGVAVAARDAEGAIRGFIHLVPSYGRPAMSLSLMRRDRSTPNGLMEFLVVKSIQLLRDRGIEEISLNFAAFGRWLDRPGGRVERTLGRFVCLGNRFFQIESLHRFNAKFAPRWEPRYLVYEGALALPQVGLAALRIEGQLPKLR